MSLNIKWTLIPRFILVIFLSTILLAGCKISAGGGTDVGNPGPTDTDSWYELELYIKSEFSENVLPSTVYTETAWWGDAVSDVSFNPPGYRYSGTNVQEPGVDESDKIKTDGHYFYIAGDTEVHIVSAVPADSMSITGTIDINGSVDTIYLYNNILIVFYLPTRDMEYLDWIGPDTDAIRWTGFSYWLPVHRHTGVFMMDISNPSSPERIKEWTFDGCMVSSRLTGGKLHMVLQFLPDLPPLQLTYDGTEEGRAGVIAENKQVMDDVLIEDLIPYYKNIDEHGNSISTSPLLTPDDFRYPQTPLHGGSIVSVTSFDLDNTTAGFKSVGLIGDANTVYASPWSLYVVSSGWSGLTFDSESEDYFRTLIYKFSLENENALLTGTGEVKGRILNQFSLGEYEDVLRIATGEGTWGQTPSSNIYCLKVIDARLQIIGKLEGLAPGEDIYSARFMGTRGFLVTFVKIDPLFTIDLSDPSNPIVAGKLEVPGYSEYIHPLGDNYLITIGKDVLEENGNTWYQGLQLSVFDISDFDHPHLLHTELIGDRGTHSEALNNHRAFTFWPENNLLAIPVDLYEYQDEPEYPYSIGENTFTGLYVYRVSADRGFEYLGRISTARKTPQIYTGDYWTRGIFIDQDVYAVNDEAVRSAPIEDMEDSATSELLFPVSD